MEIFYRNRDLQDSSKKTEVMGEETDECLECGEIVDLSELDMFGGMCEECRQSYEED